MDLDGEERDAKARRVVDLKVREVSVVDRPANTVEFLVRKRLENNGMEAFDSSELSEEDLAEIKQVEVEVTKALTDLGFSFEEIDVEKALPEDLKAALGKVVPWMRLMGGRAEGDLKGQIMLVAAFLSKVASGQYPYPSTAAKQAKPEEEEDEMKGKKKQAKPEEEEEEMQGKDKKKKEEKQKALSLDELAPEVLASIDAEGNLIAVEKGRRHLTTERTAAISNATKNLLSLLKDADEEEYKRLVSTFKELPKDTKVPTSITKAEIAEAVKESLAPVEKRLDEIEKSRAPSKSVDPDGGTDKKVETRKSLWDGLL